MNAKETEMLKLETTLHNATRRAVHKAGGPVTIGAILKEARPIEGFVEDFRRVAVDVTEVIDWTDRGDPLRDVARHTRRCLAEGSGTCAVCRPQG